MIALIFLFLVLLVIHLFRLKPPKRTAIILTDPEKITELLSLPLLVTLPARALPNSRLVPAFNLTNSFVTSSPSVHKSFLRHATHLINLRPPSELQGYVDTISFLTPGETRKLVDHTRIVTFRAVVKCFWPSVIVADVDAKIITEEINALWVQSKSSPEKLSPTKLFETVDRVFKNSDEENPLDIIIPAYETLWRGTLRGALEYRDGFDIGEVVTEVLRLYPPTKRIYRRVGGVVWKVDVEAVQRDTSIWGDDAERFKPGRECVKEGWWVFGGGRSRCPAGNGFGVEMMKVLVGGISKGGEVVGELEREERGRLANDRCSYGEVWIRGRSQEALGAIE